MLSLFNIHRAVQPILGVLFLEVIVVGFMNALSFSPIFAAERPTLQREHSKGLYSTCVWFSALLDVESLFVIAMVRSAVQRLASLLTCCIAARCQRNSFRNHVLLHDVARLSDTPF